MQLLQILNDFKKSHRILVFYKIFGLLLAFSTNLEFQNISDQFFINFSWHQCIRDS